MWTITLSPEQIAIADEVGLLRRQDAMRRSRRAANNAPEDYATALRFDIDGARAELGLAIILRPCRWNYLAQRIHHLPDIVKGRWAIDVKGRTKSWHNMIVQRGDEDHWAFVLGCLATFPTITYKGWETGVNVKLPTYWKDPAGNRAAYFVPAAALRPMEALDLT